MAGRSGEEGVAVLMRYTLRLLTLQQFQRATALICACERLRQEALASGDERWGREPFRLGLWVGARTTPNKTKHSDSVLHSLRDVEPTVNLVVAGEMDDDPRVPGDGGRRNSAYLLVSSWRSLAGRRLCGAPRSG